MAAHAATDTPLQPRLSRGNPLSGNGPDAFLGRRPIRGTGACLLVALGVLLAGCGSTGRHGAESAPLPTLPATLRNAHGDLTREAAKYLFLAEGRLVSRCMADAGFRFVVRLPPGQAVSRTSTANYGRLDVSTARRYGYRDPSRTSVEIRTFVSDDPNQSFMASLSKSRRQAYSVALFGHVDTRITIDLPGGESITTNQDGCTSEARRLLYGRDLVTWLRNQFVATNLNREVFRHVTADPAYHKATSNWQACMKHRHRVFETPEAARQAAARTRGGGTAATTPTTAEITIAVADAECQRVSRLVDVAERLDRRYRNSVSADLSTEINAYHLARAEAVRRAPELLRHH